MSDTAKLALVVGLALALLAAERLRPGAERQRPEWLNNVVAILLATVAASSLGPLIAASEAGLIASAGGGLVDLSRLPLWLGAALWFVAMDLGEYLFHRAQHAIPALWAMHSLHHSDRGMNVLTVQRHFWLESAIKAVTIWPAVALLFRPDGPILLAYYLITLNNLVTHANLRLGYGPLTWLINSPQYHRLHHSADPAHHNANFAAVLPIFDVVSGAYRRPARGEFPETGLNVAVEGPLDLLLWPVRGLVFPARGRAA